MSRLEFLTDEQQVVWDVVMDLPIMWSDQISPLLVWSSVNEPALPLSTIRQTLRGLIHVGLLYRVDQNLYGITSAAYAIEQQLAEQRQAKVKISGGAT